MKIRFIMSKKEKNVEMGSPMKMPDLASYMQTVIEQLEADKKRSAGTYLYVCVEIYRGVLRWGRNADAGG